MPNAIAYLVLFGWPLVTLLLYSNRPPAEATVLTVLGAYLLLPVHLSVDPPLIPPLDKGSLPNLGALIACLVIGKARRQRRNKHIGWAHLFLTIYVLSPFATAAVNGDSIRVGGKMLAPMTIYDATSTSIQIAIYSCIPFWLGYTYIKRYDHIRFLLKSLAVAGAIYSLFILIEIRLSPQLHTWIYGYFPHQFVQQMRLGGFRPVVFLGHGLVVAFFMLLATTAATGLWRMRVRVTSAPAGLLAVYLWVIVLACKSMAALVYASFLVLCINSSKPATQLRIASVIALFILTFPLLRISSYFPTESIVGIANSVDRERADSLLFRFNQEQDMIVRARQRPWFGWGSWGRYRTYSKDTGEDISVTDSRWFITFGQSGALGFFAEFGLLLIPVLRARSALGPGVTAKERTALSVMALMLATVGLESLVNDAVSPLTLLFAGALASYGDDLRQVQRRWRHARRTALTANPDPNLEAMPADDSTGLAPQPSQG
jgi:hypothetical protein